MFQFTYKGRFESIITKETYELYIQKLYNDLKKTFEVKFTPKKFIVTLEIDIKKTQGWGGNTDIKIDGNDIIYTLSLQLHGFTKEEQNEFVIRRFFGLLITHEMFHFFIPHVEDNSCWSEGVTDFMALWYLDTIQESLLRLQKEYKEIEDAKYKKHKYGYITGLKKMVKLYNEDKTVFDIMKQIIKDFNKNLETKQKKYKSLDIISYDKRFKTFFNSKCNNHIVHKLT
jgi:hypothetical protein